MTEFKLSENLSKKSNKYDLCFLFYKGSILVKNNKDVIHIPSFEEIEQFSFKYENEFFVADFKDKSCFVIEADSYGHLSENFKLIPLRELGILADETIFVIAGRASQILNFHNTHKFCSKCGSNTENKKDEVAKICSKCGYVMYPVICPAVIVAITKGDKILLAHNSNFKNNLYGLIAGFVEAGESLEETVKREIKEEVGVNVKNIKYYSSTPWPFPNSLMLGFFAEYESGEIRVDGKEITHADWFDKDSFPNIPPKFTVARRIIDEFINRNKK